MRSALTRTQYWSPWTNSDESVATLALAENGLLPFQPLPSGVQVVAAVVSSHSFGLPCVQSQMPPVNRVTSTS